MLAVLEISVKKLIELLRTKIALEEKKRKKKIKRAVC